MVLHYIHSSLLTFSRHSTALSSCLALPQPVSDEDSVTLLTVFLPFLLNHPHRQVLRTRKGCWLRQLCTSPPGTFVFVPAHGGFPLGQTPNEQLDGSEYECGSLGRYLQVVFPILESLISTCKNVEVQPKTLLITEH